MLKVVHRGAGVIALLTIAAFWIATAISELSGSEAAVRAVKTAIPWGLLLLAPAMAAAGASGVAVASGRRGRAIDAKMRRMPLIAANAAGVLIPSALFLASKARAGEYDLAFQAVQALELAAGAANIVLLSLNLRDGLRMTGRFRRAKAQSPGAAAGG